MKTTLLFLSFLLFAFSTTSLLVAAGHTLDPVLDINGDELQASERYYALPLIWAMGGGLTVSRNINGSLCPLNVVQSLSEIDNGYPLTFTPILDKEDVIRVSTPLDIGFLNMMTICIQSNVWTVEGSFVTTNGSGGSIIRNFQIQKYRETPMGQTYKFVYCVARMVCQDIGRSSVNGVRALTLLVEPYEMVFVKVAVEVAQIAGEFNGSEFIWEEVVELIRLKVGIWVKKAYELHHFFSSGIPIQVFKYFGSFVILIEAELDCPVKSSWKVLGRDVDGVSFIMGLPFGFML
ncbi:hypothetical protein F0562_014331 [Nyssa sinensis]|uniref:Uncharacterized protein n=1 Tax=Nyssa sinensis TaxID=561372 RepID=A0A5J4ZN48_9ASTE|nr:hypothetical protein F0562_014331 [Nyssa sinensis]